MSETLNILHVSDIHFGREDRAAVDAFTRYHQELRPDAIAISGDLTQRGTRAEFLIASAWAEALDTPVIASPGNHDTPMFNMRERVRDAFRRYRDHMGPEDDVLRLRSSTFASVNTARGWQARQNWAEGSFNLAELQRSLRALHGRNRAPFGALVCHHPLWRPEGATLSVRTKRATIAALMIAQSPAEAVLCGHVHQPSAEVKVVGGRAVLQITAGTLSTRVRGEPASFNHVEVTDDAIRIMALVVHGGKVTHRPLGSFARTPLAAGGEAERDDPEAATPGRAGNKRATRASGF